MDTTESAEAESRRIVSYPAYKHKLVADFIQKIYSELGHSGYNSKEAIAAVHKLAPNSVRSTLAAGLLYGLLEIKHGTGYKVSQLAITIFRPIDEAEKNVAILKSLKTPELFDELFQTYENHVVPVAGLANGLMRNHKLNENTAQRISDIFIASLKDYGLINQHNILTTNGFVSPKAEKAPVPGANHVVTGDNHVVTPDIEVKEQRQNGQNVAAKYPNMIDIVIPLKSTSEKAHLLLPDNFTEEDLIRISKFVEALK